MRIFDHPGRRPARGCDRWARPAAGWLLGAAAVLILAAGCHSWRYDAGDRGPLSLRPASAPGSLLPDEGIPPASPAAWDTASGDTLAPTIEQLRQYLDEANPAIRAAEAALAGARARARQAGRWADPELDGRVLFRDGEQEAEGALRFALPLNRELGAARQEATVAVTRAHLELASTRFGVQRDLDRVLAELATAHARARVFEEVSARAAAYADLARQRQAAGLADPLDVSLIMAGAAKDRRSAVQSRDETQRLRAELARLLNISAPLAVDAQLPKGAGAGLPPTDRLLEQADQSSPDWRAAQLAYEEAEWRAEAAARARVPNPTLGPAVTADEERTTWGVAFGIEVPVFANRGAAYAEALARRDGAYEALLAERQHTRTRIQRLHEHLRAVDRQLALTEGEPLRAARDALQLAEDRYEAGQIDVVVLLSAHRAYADLLLEVLALRLDRERARLELEKVIGYPLDRLTDASAKTGEPEGGRIQ